MFSRYATREKSKSRSLAIVGSLLRIAAADLCSRSESRFRIRPATSVELDEGINEGRPSTKTASSAKLEGKERKERLWRLFQECQEGRTTSRTVGGQSLGDFPNPPFLALTDLATPPAVKMEGRKYTYNLPSMISTTTIRINGGDKGIARIFEGEGPFQCVTQRSVLWCDLMKVTQLGSAQRWNQIGTK